MYKLEPHKHGYAITHYGDIVETFDTDEHSDAKIQLAKLNTPLLIEVHFLQARGVWRTIRGKKQFVPSEEFWNNSYICKDCESEEQALRRVQIIFGGNHVLRDLRAVILPHS